MRAHCRRLHRRRLREAGVNADDVCECGLYFEAHAGGCLLKCPQRREGFQCCLPRLQPGVVSCARVVLAADAGKRKQDAREVG